MLTGCMTGKMQKTSAAISDRLSGILFDLSSFIGHDSSSAALPVCESRDRDSFIKRVHSFRPSSWFAKPHWLSPVMCARYGWVNVDVDLLHCVGCQSVLVVRTPSSFDPAVYDACQKRLEDQLKRTAHHPCCTWSSCPTPEVFILAHNDTSSRATVVEDFINQVQLLYSVGKDLPAIERSSLNIAESDVTALCSLVRNDPKFLHGMETPDALQSTVLLALTGWDLSDAGKALQGCVSVRCSLCMRQPGLWNYISIAAGNDGVPSVESQDDGEPLFECQSDTGKEFEDTQTAGSPSPCDIINDQLLPCEVDGMHSATDDTNFSAVVEGLLPSVTAEKCTDLQESVVLFKDFEALNDAQDRLPSSSKDDEPRSLVISASEADDVDGAANDMLRIADTDGDHSDMTPVGFLPSESELCRSSAVGQVEHCMESAENSDDKEIVAHDNGLQVTDGHLPSDTVQQERNAVDTDVTEETKIEQSKNDSDGLHVGLEGDSTSDYEETKCDAAAAAESDGDETTNDAASSLTARDSHEPWENVGNCGSYKSVISNEAVDEDLPDSSNPEDFTCTSFELTGNSAYDNETVKEEEVVHESESMMQCDAASNLTTRDFSHAPCGNVGDCSRDKSIGSVKNVEQDLPNSSNPEDLSCMSVELPGNSVDVNVTVEKEKVIHESESMIQCVEESEGLESHSQESLPEPDTETVPLDLTSRIR